MTVIFTAGTSDGGGIMGLRPGMEYGLSVACNMITPKERLFCNGHNTRESHITSRCSCRKAQQTLAMKFSQSRVA